MYNDEELNLHVETIVAEAVSFIVASGLVEFNQIWQWFEQSDIIKDLRNGNIFLAYMTIDSLVFCLLDEMNVPIDDNAKNNMLNRIRRRENNLLALWVTKTEWQVTQRLGLSYQNIHEVVLYNDICNFFAMYHVFITPNNIIDEVYKPLLESRKNNE